MTDTPIAATEGGLLPCPFCGGEAFLHKAAGGAIWTLARHADNCPMAPEPIYYLTEAEAVAAWNSRAPAEDVRRYRRLRVLGCAPDTWPGLEDGLVLRFTNLDHFVDADLAATPSRGEA